MVSAYQCILLWKKPEKTRGIIEMTLLVTTFFQHAHDLVTPARSIAIFRRARWSKIPSLEETHTCKELHPTGCDI
jgi:hypothetical protein